MLEMGAILDDKWVILELIGKGAMGEVYRAHQSNLKRDVAIKIISKEVWAELENEPEEQAIAFGRFEREVQTMARVRHTNILNIYDYGETIAAGDDREGNIAYIVMEYIPGNSLRFTMSEDGLDDIPGEYVKWLEKYFLPVLDGVEELHNSGIVHRDLKPENIFMDGDVPKIADFGLARSQHMKSVTASIEMLGTLAYMSPEQSADFKNAGFASDIYALGKILYEAVDGTLTEKTLPFTSVSLKSAQSKFLAEVSNVIKKAASVSPEDRFQTVPELRAALLKSLSIYHEEQLEIQGAKLSRSPIIKERYSPFKYVIVSLALVIAITGIIGGYYFVGIRGSSSGPDDNSYSNHDESVLHQQRIIVEADQDVAAAITGRDGSRMVLTGNIRMDGSTSPFYLDEKQVTNFMFVEFLNSIRNELIVKDGVVWKDDKIINYIATNPQSSEAIIHEHDRFHLRDQQHGDQPVVRITFHGAHLYAAHYGKELLASSDWEFAYQFHLGASDQGLSSSGQTKIQTSSGMMHSISNDNPRGDGQELLGGMGVKVKEWVNISEDAYQDEGSILNQSYVAGVIDVSTLAENSLPAQRSPWEGFDDVGFRTKIAIVKQ